MTQAWFEEDLAELSHRQQLRHPRTLDAPDGIHGALDGAQVTVFCSNDYLGLRSNPELIAQVTEACAAQHLGVGASRLVSGDHPAHALAERALALWLRSESALLFSSGYALNASVIPALVSSDDVLFSDALNHASIVDGARLSRGRTVIYPHGDTLALAHAIERARPFRRGWIASESIFSMDGDLAPLATLRALADREGLGLYIDEAHALGVLGPQGRGACALAEIRPDVLVGTAGKALGSVGAFVTGSALLRQLLWNRARGLVFSTGVSPSSALALRAAVEFAADRPDLRETLALRCAQLRWALALRDVPCGGDACAPILSLVVGDESRAVQVSQALLARGYFVSAIRPPTVPRGTSRLRITLSAQHQPHELDGLAHALALSLRELP
ncbi:MAG: 8-amino-7-oxononanoate synthase [Deltaproteobacteria bacterium]|nr:8-amino-7-oxononanoate synthase [Deltaproteobacteria bacterium]